MKNKFLKNKKGFTLIETMVAVFILSVALVSLLTLISNTIFYAKYAENEIIANYLMQEVVDSIKNERSSNILSPNPSSWEDFVNKFEECNNANGCRIDAKVGSSSITPCVSNDDNVCESLIYHENPYNGSFYNYDNSDSNGKNSGFVRKIIISSNDHEMKMEVTVFWKSGLTNNEVSLNASVLDWLK